VVVVAAAGPMMRKVLIIPYGGAGKRHSLGAGRFNRATATSGAKVAQHPQGLALTPAQGGGAI
jgi:hypothetical protein